MSGLIDMKARWYDSSNARFLSEDTWPGRMTEPYTQSRYAYVGNNPINMWDPTGNVPEQVNVPGWVKENTDRLVFDKTDPDRGDTDFYHMWLFDRHSTHSETELIDYNETQKQKTWTYTTTDVEDWYYDYYYIEDFWGFFIEIHEGPNEEHYQQKDGYKWEKIVTAEEIAQENQDYLLQYGSAENITTITQPEFTKSTSSLNRKTITNDMIMKSLSIFDVSPVDKEDIIQRSYAQIQPVFA